MKYLPVWFQRVESVAIACLVTVAFIKLGFNWWWLLVLFLIFDVSMVGYVANKKLGAILYNIGHIYFIPSFLFLIYVLNGGSGWAFVSLIWAFHIAVDRAMGYGMKEQAGFEHTHLGRIGKNRN